MEVNSFKLVSIKLTGMPGFEEDLFVDCNKHLTTLIGPNGAGKTTTLLAIESVFNFLNLCKFDKDGVSFDFWLNWDEVELIFESLTTFNNSPNILKNIGKEFNTFKLKISNVNNRLIIKRIETNVGGYELIDVNEPYLKSEQLQNYTTELNKKTAEKENQATNLNNLKKSNPNHPQIAEYQKIIDSLNIQSKELQSKIAQENIALLNFGPSVLRREDLENLLRELRLPSIKFIKFGETDFSDIDATIKKITEIRGGNHPDEKYQSIKNEIKELLQQDPHFFNTRNNGTDSLLLNGVDYKKASTGTKICLFYYSLIYETNSNDLILWDEPENGLHPTRRFKLLDLILKDSRQFILATHSIELAPVFDDRCNVIRTYCEYKSNKNIITFQRTTDRRHAFTLADSLGLNPARLLFTANVAIWVEGPSDMIFWREALKLHDLGKTFVEGFDYTFLMYGGKCISHLTAMETNQKLNILSVSSHPIFIVDSDISVDEHFLNPENNLKTAAKDIMDQFNNDTREPGNSLFLFSLAREMENYITADAIKYAIKKVAVSITDEELTQANISNDDWPKVEKYYDMIERKFNVANIGSRNDEGIFSAKGHTRWGENNKTEVIKNAMEMPNLSISDFKHGSVEQIEKIVMFIKRWQI